MFNKLNYDESFDKFIESKTEEALSANNNLALEIIRKMTSLRDYLIGKYRTLERENKRNEEKYLEIYNFVSRMVEENKLSYEDTKDIYEKD